MSVTTGSWPSIEKAVEQIPDGQRSQMVHCEAPANMNESQHQGRDAMQMQGLLEGCTIGAVRISGGQKIPHTTWNACAA